MHLVNFSFSFSFLITSDIQVNTSISPSLYSNLKFEHIEHWSTQAFKVGWALFVSNYDFSQMPTNYILFRFDN